jgi:hypothetical protein
MEGIMSQLKSELWRRLLRLVGIFGEIREDGCVVPSKKGGESLEPPDSTSPTPTLIYLPVPPIQKMDIALDNVKETAWMHLIL